MKQRAYLGVTLLLALFISGCTTVYNIAVPPENAAAVPLSEQEIADSTNRKIWGLYVDLPGTSRVSSRQKGTQIKWRWVRQGQVIEEVWYAVGSQDPIRAQLIQRGQQPGTLHLQTLGTFGGVWVGQVQNDGSVLFQATSSLSPSFQVALATDGALELREATITDGVLTSVSKALPENRYSKTATMPVRAPSLRASERKPASVPQVKKTSPTTTKSAAALRAEKNAALRNAALAMEDD